MTPANIESSVARLLPLVEQLEQIINEETEALKARDTSVLERTTESKRQGLAQLARQWRDSGLETLLAQPGSARQYPAIATLVERVTNLRQRNEVAGGAINTLLRSTRESLNLLGLTTEPGAYGASGQGAGSIRSRSLGTV